MDIPAVQEYRRRTCAKKVVDNIDGPKLPTNLFRISGYLLLGISGYANNRKPPKLPIAQIGYFGCFLNN